MAERSQVIVVTGASAGIGRATVRAFARGRKQVAIALLARGREGLEEARREVEDAGGEALVIPTDVADAAQVEAAAERAERELGSIDVWVNCAMVSVFSPVREMAPEEFRRVTEVTYLGYVYGTLAAMRRMGRRNEGVIVQVSSALGYRSIPLQSAYCAAKHAIVGFTESLRSELIHDKSRIRVTMVHLPSHDTPQFDQVKSRLSHRAQPVPPIFAPEVAARAIVWAAAHPRRSVTVGAPALKAIVGNKLFPGLIDRYLARTAFSGQQTDAPEDPNRPHNLWAPVPGDRGAHGRFGEQAKSRSLYTWLNLHRRILGVVSLGVAAAGALATLPRGHLLASGSR
jgi:NAD(P)-dependent dehydrogenase (short-subunit alcohol dehydrogenase family)